MAPTFGKEGQLTVVGWSGRSGSNKFYILKCVECLKDMELFGQGYFRSPKGSLLMGKVPCGCARACKWSKEQYDVLCTRKAENLGYTFIGFNGNWRGAFTRISMLCQKHGRWDSGSVDNLLINEATCPSCGIDGISQSRIKPDKEMIASFFASGAFHPETKFWRSERRNSYGSPVYWHLLCPECGKTGEATSGNLQKGRRSCECSNQRQQECYINWIVDPISNVSVAIKFGIANNSKVRAKNQNRVSAYNIDQYSIYSFVSVEACKKAERECKQELECGIVLKRDMPDGYTETTWVYNLDRIVEIYERNGGVKIE